MSAFEIGLLVAIAAVPASWVAAGWGGVLTLAILYAWLAAQEWAYRRSCSGSAPGPTDDGCQLKNTDN